MYSFDDEFPENDNIWEFSNPREVATRAKRFYNTKIYRSTRPTKKYMIFDNVNKKFIHFGQMYYEDFTKHQDTKRRENYLRRSAGIQGNWQQNLFSPNNLSRLLLW